MSDTERPLLSVVVPVFNQAASIVANLQIIRERVSDELGAEIEIVVVSDGSIDATEDELVASAPDGAFRVLHYDRNLGKGYAIKVGALEAEGEWIGFVDADLDLDPQDLAVYVRAAREHELDFAIGSKRHPGSQVHYPASRVVASWMFQQLVRVLFRLNVRDTQVGLKVFRREIAEQVLPLLLVKRYAFDIELLAVSGAFGFDRIEEMPVRLDYRFTGSGVRSRAVLRALVDTAAIFYRLRILHYYQRRRALGGAFAWTRPRGERPFVSVILSQGARFREPDYPEVEIFDALDGSGTTVRRVAEEARGEVLALLEPEASASANWLAASVPFFARSEIDLVVTPKLAPLHGPTPARAAAAISESRIGAGLSYFRFTPGNVRYVDDFPSASFVVRRSSFLALPSDLPLEDTVAAIVERGAHALYTPEAVIVANPPPLVLPHLELAFGRGRRRGKRPADRVTALIVTTIVVIVLIAATAIWDGIVRDVLVVAAVAYLLAVFVACVAAALRFQSLAVSLLAGVGIPATHVAYGLGFLRGLVERSQ